MNDSKKSSLRDTSARVYSKGAAPLHPGVPTPAVEWAESLS